MIVSFRTGSYAAALPLLVFLAVGCASQRERALPPAKPNETPWSVRMADSIMAQHPDPSLWEVDEKRRKPKWSYATAFATHAVAQLGVSRGEAKYIDYGKKYMEPFIDEDGQFRKGVYKPKDYKLDDVQPGRLLLLLLKQTNEPRYRAAADALIEQLKTQPRTSEGGYWH